MVKQRLQFWIKPFNYLRSVSLPPVHPSTCLSIHPSVYPTILLPIKYLQEINLGSKILKKFCQEACMLPGVWGLFALLLFLVELVLFSTLWGNFSFWQEDRKNTMSPNSLRVKYLPEFSCSLLNFFKTAVSLNSYLLDHNMQCSV